MAWALGRCLREGALLGALVGGLAYGLPLLLAAVSGPRAPDPFDPQPVGPLDRLWDALGSFVLWSGFGLVPGAAAGLVVGLLCLAAATVLTVRGRTRATWVLVAVVLAVAAPALTVTLGSTVGGSSRWWLGSGLAAAALGLWRTRAALRVRDRQREAADSADQPEVAAAAMGPVGPHRWWLVRRTVAEGAVWGAVLGVTLMSVLFYARQHEEAGRGVADPVGPADLLGIVFFSGAAAWPGALIGVVLALLALAAAAVARALSPAEGGLARLAPTLVLGGVIVLPGLILSRDAVLVWLAIAAVPVLLNAWRARSVVRALDRRRALDAG
ncbi:hypothetical protein [Jannaschia sp. R86511]|uniref:hypothetical protein n=1 Tax=Jannaschia sp. R86511 TaxID=3093853 RepID=UPI0036D3E07F